MYHTVMVVDDSKLEIFLAETMIRNSKFAETVISYNSGDEALEYLINNSAHKEKMPQVIFVDIYMPVMSGFEFLDRYLELSESVRADIKIVMFSSSQAHEDFVKMKQYPVIRKFLSKPLTPAMFVELKDTI